MEDILHQLRLRSLLIPLFTRFYTSKRWVVAGFLKNQQYQPNVDKSYGWSTYS